MTEEWEPSGSSGIAEAGDRFPASLAGDEPAPPSTLVASHQAVRAEAEARPPGEFLCSSFELDCARFVEHAKRLARRRSAQAVRARTYWDRR